LVEVVDLSDEVYERLRILVINISFVAFDGDTVLPIRKISRLHLRIDALVLNSRRVLSDITLRFELGLAESELFRSRCSSVVEIILVHELPLGVQVELVVGRLRSTSPNLNLLAREVSLLLSLMKPADSFDHLNYVPVFNEVDCSAW